jgi:hypothetical protein
MYLIAWTKKGVKDWEVVSGYDAMQERVSELVDEEGLDADEDIVVGEINDDTK